MAIQRPRMDIQTILFSSTNIHINVMEGAFQFNLIYICGRPIFVYNYRRKYFVLKKKLFLQVCAIKYFKCQIRTNEMKESIFLNLNYFTICTVKKRQCYKDIPRIFTIAKVRSIVLSNYYYFFWRYYLQIQLYTANSF